MKILTPSEKERRYRKSVTSLLKRLVLYLYCSVAIKPSHETEELNYKIFWSYENQINMNKTD